MATGISKSFASIKKQNAYEWQEQPDQFYIFWNRVELLKEHAFWNEGAAIKRLHTVGIN